MPISSNRPHPRGRIHVMRAAVIALVCIATFLGNGGVCVAAELLKTGRIALAYDIYLGGFLAGMVDLEARLNGTDYMIRSESRTLGILDFLVGFVGQAEVAGKANDAVIRPTRYRTENLWFGNKRFVSNDYLADGTVRSKAQPTAAQDDRVPVPESLTRDTIDPLSASFQAALNAAGKDGCHGTLDVFDGRRRYNVTLTSLGQQHLDGPFHDGPTQLCRVKRKRIAGFSTRVWLPGLKGPPWMDIWMATLRPGYPPLPLRAEADIGMGAMVVHLVAVDGRKLPPGNLP